jgi:hypothetical protein
VLLPRRSPTARKKLAVPYRAAHTPSERSEFAQPDVALLLTHISYYADGLSMPQFEQVLQELLGMGDNAKRDHYRGWLQLLPPERIEPGAVGSSAWKGGLLFMSWPKFTRDLFNGLYL